MKYFFKTGYWYSKSISIGCKNPLIAILATNKPKPTHIQGWVFTFLYQLWKWEPTFHKDVNKKIYILMRKEGQKGRGKREEREIKYFILFVSVVYIILMSFM